MNPSELFRNEKLLEDAIQALQKKISAVDKWADDDDTAPRRLVQSQKNETLRALSEALQELSHETRREFAEEKRDFANSQLEAAHSKRKDIIERKAQGEHMPMDALSLRILDRHIATLNQRINRYTESLEVIDEIEASEERSLRIAL